MKTQKNPFMATLLLSLAGFVFSCGATNTNIDTSIPIPEQHDQGNISNFILKDVDGRTYALSDYLGTNVIVLSFWATWCEPCKKELNQLQKLHDTLQEDGLAILSISMDEPESQGDVRPFVKQRAYTFPVLLDTESIVTGQFNPRRAAPYNLIIDRNQQIVWSHEGYVPGDEEKLEHAILTALGKVPE